MSEFCEKLEEKLKEVMTSERGNFRFMEPMKRHTTFRIGGPAAVFISPGSEEELREVLNLLKEENIPWTILGNGSNLLVSDEGFKGAVISMSEGWAYSGVLREDEKAGKTLIRAGAGELLSRTARLAMECALTGMEFASGIPGTDRKRQGREGESSGLCGGDCSIAGTAPDGGHFPGKNGPVSRELVEGQCPSFFV